jgi:hypothetical protein
MRFSGKVAIVTGSSDGIGKAAALIFAREGGQVVLNARAGIDWSGASRGTGVGSRPLSWRETPASPPWWTGGWARRSSCSVASLSW